MAKKKRVVIELTPDQLAQLAPVFKRQNEMDYGACIVAQVFVDGLNVNVLTREQSERLIEILATSPEHAAKIRNTPTNSAHGGIRPL